MLRSELKPADYRICTLNHLAILSLALSVDLYHPRMVFKGKAYLRYNLNTIKFTYYKYAV